MDLRQVCWHKTTMNVSRILTIWVCIVLLSACGGRAFIHETYDATDLRARATTETEGQITVSAAVPSREETTAVFGIDLYDKGIQPVWLEIQNSSETIARYAPVSTDRYYFPPQEIVYKNRKGYSDEARAAMHRHFDALALKRFIHAGETRSGFVFTHVDWGAKGFNVDVFNAGSAHHFYFLERVPGFVPDYADITFNTIYSDAEVRNLDSKALHEALKTMPCCSNDSAGNVDDDALNLVLIGSGRELLIGLLRSGWLETAAADAAGKRADYLFGRPQDAILRYESKADDSIYEMRVWLAPLLQEGDRVWFAQVRHYYKTAGFLIADPDIDNARGFVLQNLIYGQALRQLGWIEGDEVVPVDTFFRNPIRPAYFTDGHVLVMWLDAEPVSLRDIVVMRWDDIPESSK